ncbi:MAG: hypothetical protein FJ009_01515 [Chloroflexi bacterium]|nr:hypothetical protein [Chloroflexota bacterium]
MNRANLTRQFLLFGISVFALACNLASLALAPTPTITAPAPTLTRPPSATPTRAPRAGAPTWWDARIALPASFNFEGDARRAMWSTRDVNVEAIKDFLLAQTQGAGYRVFVITQSRGAIYDLLCVKGQDALALNLTLGSDTTIITAQRVGVLRLKVTGAANVELDLPLRARLDPKPGSEISIGTAVPSSQCARCEYFINVHIAPFKGVGNYDSKPGTYLIDVQVIPGGDPDKDDFRWPIGGCTVTVKESSGAFECKQLQNVNDQTKRIDVSGSWVQP